MSQVEKLDGKVYGQLFSEKTNELIPADEYIVFRIHDAQLVGTLEDYQQRCRNAGCAPEQLAAMQERIDRVAAWQAEHPERLKNADVAPGELNKSLGQHQ